MKENFYSYLDGFNRVTIIYPKKRGYNTKQKSFFVLVEDAMLELSITETIDLGQEMKYCCLLPESLALNIEYTVIDESHHRSLLRTGSIVRTDLFEMLYYYSQNDLGVIYTPSASTFKVWSPVAKEIEIELVSPKGEVKYFDLVGMPRGVWSICVQGDLDSYNYRYHVRLETDFKTILDPYAIASDADAKFNYVVNPAKFYQFKYPKPEFSGKMVDAIIYELHVRDFTIDKVINNPKAGKFLGLLEDCKTPNGNPTGIEYLKALGVTHVQLMPVFDFGGVDEKDSDKSYNWGYNPVQYNVPEGWYASNPEDPYARINELRELIDELHHAGIRVIMDVVYNHVYKSATFPFNNLVPGYYYRYDERGMMTDVSGCGNDIASDRKMASKFILDSTRYWMKEFKIDGFRFDLMGLLDVETINNVQMIVKSCDPAGIVYGEGWNMPINIPESERANMSNCRQMPQVGFFNDRFRDLLKGSQWNRTLGYATGGNTNYLDVLYLITGSSIDNYLLSSPNQSINYVECHDNYTLHDFIKVLNPKISDETLNDYLCLAMGMVMVSQGVPFIHAGQEFFRTKQGVENSYCSPDSINKIDWTRADMNWEYVEMLRDLIAIRKEYNVFHYDRNSVIKEWIKLRNLDITSQTLRLTYRSVDYKLYVIIKNDYKYEYIDFKDIVTLIFDGRKRVSKVRGSIELEKPGVYFLLKGRE